MKDSHLGRYFLTGRRDADRAGWRAHRTQNMGGTRLLIDADGVAVFRWKETVRRFTPICSVRPWGRRQQLLPQPGVYRP